MNLLKSGVIAATLALSMSPAQAVLVTSLDITVNSMDYTATFHDFSTDLSFNAVWDTNGDGTFGDGINAAFDKTPTFWTDATGAATARDLIIAGLGTQNWVDTSFNISDRFIIPSVHAASVAFTIWTDGHNAPGTDLSALPRFAARDLGLIHVSAWVTFERAQVPEPLTPVLLLTGLCAGWAVRRRTVRV